MVTCCTLIVCSPVERYRFNASNWTAKVRASLLKAFVALSCCWMVSTRDRRKFAIGDGRTLGAHLSGRIGPHAPVFFLNGIDAFQSNQSSFAENRVATETLALIHIRAAPQINVIDSDSCSFGSIIKRRLGIERQPRPRPTLFVCEHLGFIKRLQKRGINDGYA